MLRAFIAPPEDSNRKGRSFSALLLASIEANALCSTSTTENFRPAWALFGTTETELRPFMANLTSGRKAKIGAHYSTVNNRKPDQLELLRSAGYRVTYQRETEGSLATAFLPDLFAIDPGLVDPRTVRFLIVQSVAWAREQKVDLKPIITHVGELRRRKWFDPKATSDRIVEFAALAHLFATYLDRRTRAPIPADSRFYVQLFFRCVEAGLAGISLKPSFRHETEWGAGCGLYGYGLEDVGLLPAVGFNATHEILEPLLAEEVQRFVILTGA